MRHLMLGFTLAIGVALAAIDSRAFAQTTSQNPSVLPGVDRAAILSPETVAKMTADIKTFATELGKNVQAIVVSASEKLMKITVYFYDKVLKPQLSGESLKQMHSAMKVMYKKLASDPPELARTRRYALDVRRTKREEPQTPGPETVSTAADATATMSSPAGNQPSMLSSITDRQPQMNYISLNTTGVDGPVPEEWLADMKNSDCALLTIRHPELLEMRNQFTNVQSSENIQLYVCEKSMDSKPATPTATEGKSIVKRGSDSLILPDIQHKLTPQKEIENLQLSKLKFPDVQEAIKSLKDVSLLPKVSKRNADNDNPVGNPGSLLYSLHKVVVNKTVGDIAADVGSTVLDVVPTNVKTDIADIATGVWHSRPESIIKKLAEASMMTTQTPSESKKSET